MFSFGKKSRDNLDTCHLTLQLILREALNYSLTDMSVIEGFRGQKRQTEFYLNGKSRVPWPLGKHNKLPSLAADVVPYVNGDISWDVRHCVFQAAVIQSAAIKLGYYVRWGGNWDMDAEIMTDQDFQDLVHFELIGVMKNGTIVRTW